MRTLYTLVLLLLLSIPAHAQRAGATGCAVLKGVDFNTTADQEIKMHDCTSYIVRRIVVKNASTSLTLAVGGIYTAASKGGTPVVAATQIYSGLTGMTKFIDLTLAPILTTDVRTETVLYFSLTTAQGAAATGDIYVYYDCVN